MTDIDPIQPSIGYVNANPARDQIEALVRQAILLAAGIATAVGATKAAGTLSALLVIAGPLAGFIVVVAGQLKTRALASKAAQMANALPDHVAMTK